MTPELRKLFMLLVLLLQKRQRTALPREPCRNSTLTGHGWMQYVLNGNRTLCIQLFRMEKHVFERLCMVLRERGFLKNSRYVTVEEMVGIFLMTIAHIHSNADLCDRFQHSGETIHRHFHNVLVAMVKFSMEVIVPPSYDHVPSHIRYNPRFYPFFKGCIGAIDGTLVHAVISPEKQLPYRGRKGECMQQVMAACSFDMLFTFVVAGWEGTAHDQRILMETTYDRRLNFPHAPPGKYYVVDAGYTNMRGFLAPYRNVRYWLPDFRGAIRPRNKKELFNYRHSSLRNVIERTFGVLKARFPILKMMPSYAFPVQRSIVIAAMTIHNFIRRESIADALFEWYERDDVNLEVDVDDEDNIGQNVGNVDENAQLEMNNVREAIADALYMEN